MSRPQSISRRALPAALLAAWGAALLFPTPAEAHGVLVGRRDVPIPEWLFAWGASLVLIVSFIGLSLGWRRSRFEDDHWQRLSPGISRLAVNRVGGAVAGAFGVGLLVLVVWAGLRGTDAPDLNFNLTFVFVTFWLGGVLLSVLLGDWFRAVNPWRAIASVAGRGFTLLAGQAPQPPLRYPERVGRWPAVIGLLGFVWLELAYATGFGSIGLRPRDVAIATLVYSAWTFVGMALFGIEKWLERGEAFSVYMGMFARIAPFEVRGGDLGMRRPLAGTTSWVAVPGSVAMILASIGATAYDGAQEGVLAKPIGEVFPWLTDAGLSELTAYRLTQTLFLVLSVLAVGGIYWLGILGMHTVRGSRPTVELGRLFAHGFIPIALAYLVAHYFSLFIFLEQAQFTYLLSDPLGQGSDLFGTASGGIDYGVIGASTIWYVQVAALVAGHVTALVLGHDRALAVYGDSRLAARSQYWMLALMVGFTSLGLYLLSQANA